MIEGLGDIGSEHRLAVAPRPVPDRGRVATQQASQVSPAPEAFPASPPAEVLDMLDTAASVLQELASKQVTMHIEVVDGGAGKRIHVEVLDAEGTLLREIPPHQMFDVLAGKSRGLTYDEQA